MRYILLLDLNLCSLDVFIITCLIADMLIRLVNSNNETMSFEQT